MNQFNDNDFSGWCEYCHSYHVIPVNEYEKQVMGCKAPSKTNVHKNATRWTHNEIVCLCYGIVIGMSIVLSFYCLMIILGQIRNGINPVNMLPFTP
jgi:hypothetical protein